MNRKAQGDQESETHATSIVEMRQQRRLRQNSADKTEILGPALTLRCPGERSFRSVAAIHNDCKLFVGGIGQQTREDTLDRHFYKYGCVLDCALAVQKKSGKSRGFGFVTFDQPESCTAVLRDKHKIDGVLVECRPALAKEEARMTSLHDTVLMPNKIFVGGVPDKTSEAELKEFFLRFGLVADVSLAYDKVTHRPRGFGFVVFNSTAAANYSYGLHDFFGRTIEAKASIPRLETKAAKKKGRKFVMNEIYLSNSGSRGGDGFRNTGRSHSRKAGMAPPSGRTTATYTTTTTTGSAPPIRNTGKQSPRYVRSKTTTTYTIPFGSAKNQKCRNENSQHDGSVQEVPSGFDDGDDDLPKLPSFSQFAAMYPFHGDDEQSLSARLVPSAVLLATLPSPRWLMMKHGTAATANFLSNIWSDVPR